MKGKQMSLTVSIIILVIVVALLVYISINRTNTSAPALQEESAGTNVENTNNTNMEETNTNDGVKVTVLKEGTGEVAKAGDSVSVNYTGSLVNGTVFDSNVDKKFNHVEPFTFNLGAGQVIKGWDAGVAGMKIGEKRKLEIAPEFAYGASGIGGVIPPNATLVFEVELLAINK